MRLVLCGSALTLMSGLLVGQAPLRGRAQAEVLVAPFDFHQTARFAALDGGLPTALRVHAVCGGIPGYYVDMLVGDLPAGGGDFDAWVERGR